MDLNCSSSSVGSNESTTVPAASFYGKNVVNERSVNDYPLVKIKKLPASVIEYYLGKPPREAKDVFKPKLSRAKRKLLPVIGSDATRHSIKPLSAKKRKQNEKMKQNKDILLEIERLPVSVIEYYLGKSSSEVKGVVCGPKLSRDGIHEIEDNSENEKDLYVIEVNRRNPRRKAASNGFIQMTNACDTKELSTKSRPTQNNLVTHEVRKNPSRKAAVETCEKITKAYEDMDDTEDFDDISYYTESSISSEDVNMPSKRKEDSDDSSYYTESSSSSDDVKKPPKGKVNKFDKIPKPQFSEYEKAAQEKLASHKDFLKSLDMNSWDEI